MKKYGVFSAHFCSGALSRFTWLAAAVALSTTTLVACGGSDDTSGSPGTGASGSGGSAAGSAGSGGSAAGTAGSGGSSAGGSSAGGAAGKSAGGSAGSTAAGAGGSSAGAGGSSGKAGQAGSSGNQQGGAGGSSAGAGGSAGGPGQSCDECLMAAKAPGGDCSAQQGACDSNPDCAALASCVDACGGSPDCVLQCKSDNSGGVVEYGDLTACLDQACAPACSGGSGGSGGSGPDACASKLDCSTCSEHNACVDCCKSVFADGYKTLSDLLVTECACVAGAPCATECADNACANQPASQACTACVQGQVNQQSECMKSGLLNCLKDSACKDAVACQQACPKPTASSCASQPDAKSCNTCCQSADPGSYDALNGSVIEACACVSGAACEAECSGNLCMGQQPPQACIDCVQGQINQKGQCVSAGIANCTGDGSCSEAVTCLKSCPK